MSQFSLSPTPDEPNLNNLPSILTAMQSGPGCVYLSDKEYGNLLAQTALLVILSFQSVRICLPRSSMCSSTRGIAL